MTINPTDVRANGSSLRGYLAVLTGTQVLEATLTADAATLSAKVLSITVNSGSIADVMRGYYVAYYASDGVTFKGQSHVRWGDVLDATHLPVREFSRSEYLLVTGDLVRVNNIMMMEDKLVEDTDTFDPDGVPVGNYNLLPPPLACSGGYDAGFVDGYETGTPLTFRTTLTNGAPSMVLDPDSIPGNLSHLWTLPTGVAFQAGSSSTDVSPILEVDVGQYTVYHDVTDNDNGQTWRQCITYAVYDAAHMPISVIMESAPAGSPDQGWSCTFRAVNFLTLAAVPDGALVIFFVRQRINGTWQSLGGAAGRSAVKLVGYLSHDESELTQPINVQRFEVVSPLNRLMNLPGFSKLLILNETADEWSRVRGLTTLRAMIQLVRIYTFALDGGHDWLTSALYVSLDYPELWLQKESPFQQVNEIADGTDAYFTCGRSGLFALNPVMPLLTPATRAGLTPAYTFQPRDVVRMVLRRSHFDTIETLELHATASPNLALPGRDIGDAVAVFSRAPGSPGHGAEFVTIERIIADPADPQNNANQRAGRRYGWRNGVDTSSVDGSKARLIELDVELREVYDFLDFDDQIVRFSGFSNPRGLDLSLYDWYLTRVQLDYASGKVLSSFAALTDSPAGETYIPPSDPLPPVVTPPPPITIITTPDPGNYDRNMADIALFNSDGLIYYLSTANYPSQSGGATPEGTESLSGLGMTGTLNDFTVDAFSPNYITSPSGAVNGWIVSSAEIRRITDIFGTPALSPATALSPGPASGTIIQMDFERGTPNWGFAAWFTAVNGVYVATTSDGINFTLRQVTAFSDTVGNVTPPGVLVNYRVAGEGYVTAYASANVPALYRLSNYGASIAQVSSPPVAPGSANLAVGLVVPFTSTPSTIFYNNSNLATTVENLMRIINGGAPVAISPQSGGDTFGMAWSNRALSISPTNPNVGVLCGWSDYTGTQPTGVWRTTNLMAAVPTWAEIVSPATSVPWRRAYVAGNDPNTCYLLGNSGYFGVITGNVLDDRSAALRAAYPGIGDNLALCGVRR